MYPPTYVVPKPKTVVIGKSRWIATKPKQMSFGKGDVIEVVEDTGKWHVGILRESKDYPITGEQQQYPPTYVLAGPASGWTEGTALYIYAHMLNNISNQSYLLQI